MLAAESNGEVTINHGQTTKQFQLSYRWYYFVGVPTEFANSDINWVIIRNERNFNSILGTWILGEFSFKFVDGEETYTTRFQLGAEYMWHKHRQVQEIKNLRIFQCTLTLYEFFAITASFDDRHTVEVIESNIETKGTKTFEFISSYSEMPFTKVNYLTVRGKENENSRVTLKILQLFPELISLKVIDNRVGEIFGNKKKWMDNLKRLHLERVEIEPYVFFDILSNCASLESFTVIGETLSGLNDRCQKKNFDKHKLTLYVDKGIMNKENLDALNKLVEHVKDLTEIEI